MVQVISMSACQEALRFPYWVALHEKQQHEMEVLKSLDGVMVDLHVGLKLHNYLEKLQAR